MIGPMSVARGDVSYSNGTYSQTFDGLYNPVTTGFNDTYNVSGGVAQTWTDNTTSSPPTSDGIDGWYASEPGPPPLTGSNFVYYVSDGAPKSSKGTLSGGIFDFGYSNPANGNVSDRALGLVGTGASGLTTVGVKLINTSSTTFTQLNIQYTGEEWFAGNMSLTTPKSLDFKYGIFNTTDNSTVSSAANADASMNFTAPVVNSGTTNGVALDGNAAANSQTITGTEQGPNVSWAPGQVLWLTWTISSSAAGGEGLAIDNLNFSAGVTPAHNLTWNAGNTTWSTSTSNTNWLNTGNSSFYTDGDFVVFGDTGVGTVNLSGTVSPGSLTVANTSGTYTFTGGSIGGNTSLAKTGAGTLSLTTANTYTGGTTVDTGTLVINNDNNLGVSTTNITLTNGATLRTAAPITSNRTLVVGAGGATLDTAGSDVSFAMLSSTGGALTKINGGNLTVGTITFNTNALSMGGGNLYITAASGTSTFAASGSYAGDIVLQGVSRLSFEGGTVGGGGNVVVNAAGAVVNAAGTNLTTDIQNNIVVNAAQAHIGASTTNTLMVDGVISGNADISYTNDPANGGKGIVQLDSHNTYSGKSVILLGDAGVVRLGISNALPTGSALSFGDGVDTSNIGAFDLNGFDQTVSSLATNYASGNASQICYGIVDSGFNAAPNTLTIIGSATTTYAGTIGNPPAFPVGTTSQIGGIHDADITLELGAGNTGCLTLTGNNSYTGGTVLDGGTLSVSNDSNLGDPSGPVTFGGGTLEITTAGFTTTSRSFTIGSGGGTIQIDPSLAVVTLSASLTATDTLTLNGAGTLQLAASSNSAARISGNGTLQIASGASLTSDAVQLNALVINGSHVIHSNSGRALSTVGSLTLGGTYGGSASAASTWTGSLDLTNSRLVVEDTSTNRANDLAILKNQALASNTANNTVGIFSSTAAAANTAAGKTAMVVVVSDNAVRMATFPAGSTNFGGVNNVDANSILVTAAFKGDANLDGVVDIQDLTDVANHWQQTVTDWSQGDFDGNNFVDIQDLTAVANNWQAGVGAGGGSSFSEALAQIGGFKPAAVPEPASLALLGIGGLMLAKRRRGR